MARGGGSQPRASPTGSSRERRPGPFHVGVLLDNTPTYLFALFGAALAGAVVVGINPTRRGAELARDIRHTACQLVLTDEGYVPLLDGLDLDGVPVVRIDEGEWPPETEPRTDRDRLEPGPDDLFVLIFTSGSTGAPKAVRMTHGRAARMASGSTWLGRDDVLYCAMPLFHGNALNAIVFPALASGATIALRPRFSASQFMPDVRRYDATFFSTVGRALSYILATPPTDEDTDHHVKFALAPESSPADIRAFRERFGISCFAGYGSSENAIIMSPVPGMPKDALGMPPEGTDAAIVDPDTLEECPRARFDDDGRLLNAADAIGELVGRNVADRFEGYYDNPEADAERTRNGWYWSGRPRLPHRGRHLLLRRTGGGVAARRCRELRHRPGGAHPLPLPAGPRRRGVRRARRAHRRRPGHGLDRVDRGGVLRPRRLRHVPRRAGRPGDQVATEVRPPRPRCRWAPPTRWTSGRSRPNAGTPTTPSTGVTTRSGPYRPFTADDLAALEARFVEHGRRIER